MPNARIVTYSYKSDWRKGDVKVSLYQCRKQLLNVLRQNQLREKVREILLSFACPVYLKYIGRNLGDRYYLSGTALGG